MSQGTNPSQPNPHPPQRPPNSGNHQTYENLRESARSSAKRKARILSKHRPALVRWTVATASSTPRKHEQTSTRGGCTASTARSNGSAPTVVAGDRRHGARIHRTDIISPLLSLACAETIGRHVVAQKGPLPAGTLLLRETPFAWSLHPEFSGEYCAHCLCKVLRYVRYSLLVYTRLSTKY